MHELYRVGMSLQSAPIEDARMFDPSFTYGKDQVGLADANHFQLRVPIPLADLEIDHIYHLNFACSTITPFALMYLNLRG